MGNAHHLTGLTVAKRRVERSENDMWTERASRFASFIERELKQEDGRQARFFRERFTAYRDPREFALLYSRKHDLGEGITGRVMKVLDRHGVERASKALNGEEERDAFAQYQELRREVAFLRVLDHPNIVKIISSFCDEHTNIQLVTEMCKGGSLASAAGVARILGRENNIACVLYQVLLALQVIHEHGIVHRDIKDENIMFISPDRSSLSIVLIDFGLSAFVGNEKTMEHVRRLHTFCGTLPYMSPEVLDANYSLKSDLWSVGILAFELLTGEFPFSGRSERSIMKQIRKGNIDFNSKKCTKLSPEGLDFIKHLLVTDPSKRWSVQIALRSPWFARCRDMIEDLPEEMEIKLVKSIRNFMSHCEATKLMLMVAAHCQSQQLPFAAREGLSKAFHSLDLDSDGILSPDEFGYLLDKHGGADQKFLVFAKVDYEGAGFITWTNYVAICFEAFVELNLAMLDKTFDYLSHGRHKVSLTELGRLAPDSRKGHLLAELERMDPDRDGYLSKSQVVKAAMMTLLPTTTTVHEPSHVPQA